MKAGTQNSWAYDLAADLAGGVCYAVGMYVFAMHADFAPGGVSGLALIANHLWGMPVGLGTLRSICRYSRWHGGLLDTIFCGGRCAAC